MYVSLVSGEVKVMDVFRLFMKNTTERDVNYLFAWIRKCSVDQAVDKMELTDEVLKSIDRLVAWDKDQARDIVMRLPAVGQKFIIALE